MKVYWNKKEYDVKLIDRITPKVAKEFTKLSKDLKTDVNYVKYKEAFAEAGIKMKDNGKGKESVTVENPSKAALAEHYSSNMSYIPENFDTEVKICHLITKETSVDKNIRDVFFEQSDNDFWQDQDIQEIKKYINFFRQKVNGVA